MKQKDIALIAIIVFIGAIFSYVLSNMLFGGSAIRQTQVETVQPITADFAKPDTRYFNKDAYDPTQVIRIGQQIQLDANTTTQ